MMNARLQWGVSTKKLSAGDAENWARMFSCDDYNYWFDSGLGVKIVREIHELKRESEIRIKPQETSRKKKNFNSRRDVKVQNLSFCENLSVELFWSRPIIFISNIREETGKWRNEIRDDNHQIRSEPDRLREKRLNYAISNVVSCFNHHHFQTWTWIRLNSTKHESYCKKNPNQVIKRSSTDGRRVWRVEKYQFWVKEMWMRNEKQQSFMVDYVFARLPMSRRESMNLREEEEVAVKANRLVEFSPSHHRAPHGQSKASISMIRRYRDENKSLSKWINNLSEQERDVRSLYDETFTRYWKWQVSQVEKL